MGNVIKKIIGDKKEYRKQMERVEALPEEYQFVYEKIQDYMWSLVGGTGLDMLQTQYDLIDLFEASSSEGKHVLDVTGKDVAAFCDQLIQGNTLWTDRVGRRLNRKMNKKLGGK